MRKSKVISTFLATLALLAGGLPVLLSAAPASAVTSIPNLPARWESISSPGSGTTCALAKNGTIWCWGIAEGARGVSWDAAKGDPAAGAAAGPKQVGTANNWVAVEVSSTHACAKNSLSELWCWGKNGNGQLGEGTNTDSQVPVKVKANNKAWYSFSVTQRQTCGIQTTGLWCWGDNGGQKILPGSASDSFIPLPRFFGSNVANATGSLVAIDQSAEIQIGGLEALKIGNKVWANVGSGFSELLLPNQQTWQTFSVRQNGSSVVESFGIVDAANGSYLTAFCGVTNLGAAYCLSRNSLSRYMQVGTFSTWKSVNIRQDGPREPICGLTRDSSSAITCYNPYGRANYDGTTGPALGSWCGGDTPIAVRYSAFTNAPSFPAIGIGCWGSIVTYKNVTLLTDINGATYDLGNGSTIASTQGGFFQGAVTGETYFNVWGRLYALTSDGRLFVMGDGKYGERQDGILNEHVTDTWSASLVQSPQITRTDRTIIPKTGGANVTLSGTFLVGVTGVTVGGKTVASWTESSDGTTLVFDSPSSLSGGSVDVTVTTDGGSSTLSNAYTYGDSPTAPSVTGLSPGDKSVAVGWSAPASSGSSPITSYTVTVAPGGSSCTWTVGPLNCSVTGLTNGTTYRATVKANSAVGPGLSSSNSSAFVPYKSPSAPNIVSISPSDGQITVTWSAATNNGSAITRYDVEAQPGGNSCSTSGTGTSCTISPLTNGTAYSISVYATNEAGGGEVASSDTLITPRTTAGAPTNLVVSPGDRQLGVSWRAPSSNGGSAVTSYTVTAQPGSVTCTAMAPSTSCNLLGLSNGSVYSVTVVATNPAGSSVSSATVTGSPVTIPGKPTISATEPGSNSVLVRWRAPSASGGASVTSYTVVASPGGNSCSTTGAVLFCTVTGLDNGTTYAFTVTATNTAGVGSASASYNGIPAASPNAPRSIVVTPTNQGLTVTWSAPTYDGGNAVTGYIATVRSTGDTCTTNAATRTCTFSGLVNGSGYIVDVVATNNAGNSEVASSISVTPRTVPSKPTQVTLTPGASTIRVSWAAPVSDGGSTITSYIATATPGSGITCTSTGTYCDFLNLTAGSTYSVTVVAVNAAGTGTASTAVSAMPFDKPGAPRDAAATADDTQINVTWTAPANTGGSDITGYIATATPSGLTCTAPSTATSCSIKGLTNGTRYTIRVAATNAAGPGPDSVIATTVIPRGVSAAPTNISVEPASQSLVVKWRAVTSTVDTNGSAIARYIAKAMPSNQTCQVDGSTGGVANTTCTISGLTNGIAQTVTVVAVNDAGQSVASSSVTRTPRSAPSAPVGVVVTPLDGAIAISWNPPVDNGGIPINSYSVLATASGVTGSVVSCTSQSGDSRNCVIGNLSNGIPYSVVVAAGNEVGIGPNSTAVTTTPATVPSSPLNPWPQVGNGQITIHWTAPAKDNGSPILSYHVALEPGGYSCDVTDITRTFCTISQLDNGVSYSIAVTATNATGDSMPAQVVGTATPRAIPNPVQSVTVSPATNQATVSWLPGFDGGSAIQSYTVTASPGGSLCQVSGTATQCLIRNLVNGTQYTFSVVAVNAAGSSAPTLTGKTLIAGTANVPVALKVKPADGMITISFAPPAINGGTPITNYTVYVNDEVACTVAPSKILSCVVNGLENGTPQVVRVTANNLIGPSVSTAEVVATPGRVSSPVTDVLVTQGVGLLTISWTEPADDGGAPITGYAVTLSPGGKTCKVDQSQNSCDIGGLTIGTSYVAKVVAINGVGTSAATNSASVKVVGAPTVVRNLSATGLAKSAKLYFAPPANNGGSNIANYYFSVTGPAGFTWESGAIAANLVKGSYTITGLTKNLTYTVSVTVDNDYGMSAAVTTTVKSK